MAWQSPPSHQYGIYLSLLSVTAEMGTGFKMDYNTYYWCPECKMGWTQEQTIQELVTDGYNYGHGNAAAPEYKQVCPDCESDCVEGYKCDICQEIHEHVYAHRDSHICADCLPAQLVSESLANMHFLVSVQLMTTMKLDYTVAKAKAAEAINSYDFNEGV